MARQTRKQVAAEIMRRRPEYTEVEVVQSRCKMYWYATAMRNGQPVVSGGCYCTQLKYLTVEEFIATLDAN